MNTQPHPADLTFQLPRDLYYLVVHQLRDMLPPPPVDSPDAEARCLNAAIAHVASLLPANADEADIAARYVGFAAYAKDCLRLARQYRDEPDLRRFLQCTAMAASTERQARGARMLLQRVQSERRKREADPKATDQAAWIEHCAAGLMADALAAPGSPPVPEPPPPDPEPPAASEPLAEEPQADLAAEAEQYAIIYPRRAARIRSLGRLPEPCDFGPPSQELVQAIVTGTSPALRDLDNHSIVSLDGR
jgi:hypothetical protein